MANPMDISHQETGRKEEAKWMSGKITRYQRLLANQFMRTPGLEKHLQKNLTIFKGSLDLQRQGARANMENLRYLDSDLEIHFQALYKDITTISSILWGIKTLGSFLISTLHEEYSTVTPSPGGKNNPAWERNGKCLAGLGESTAVQEAIARELQIDVGKLKTCGERTKIIIAESLINQEWAQERLIRYATNREWNISYKKMVMDHRWQDLAAKLKRDKKCLLDCSPPGTNWTTPIYHERDDPMTTKAKTAYRSLQSVITKYFQRLQSARDFELSSHAKRLQGNIDDRATEPTQPPKGASGFRARLRNLTGSIRNSSSTNRPLTNTRQGSSRHEGSPPPYTEKP